MLTAEMRVGSKRKKRCMKGVKREIHREIAISLRKAIGGSEGVWVEKGVCEGV